MNVMTRLLNSLPAYWEYVKTYILPSSREESEDGFEEPPSKRRRVDADSLLLGIPEPEKIDRARHRMYHLYNESACDPIFPSETVCRKPKRKLRLESPVGESMTVNGRNFSDNEKENIERRLSDNEKENIIEKKLSDNEKEEKENVSDAPDRSEDEASTKDEKQSRKPDLKLKSVPEERGTWFDAASTCRVFTSSDTKNDKENDAQQLKSNAPSFLEKRNFPTSLPPEFRAKMFNTTTKPLSRPEMSGGGGTSSLKRPNSNSLSSLCSSQSSPGGRKLQLLDQSIRLDEREKYSELLQTYTRVPVMKHPIFQARRAKSPPVSFASHTRKRYGNKVEVIDLTSQTESKDEFKKLGALSEKLGGKSAGYIEPLPSSELKKKLDKCNVYDVSWIEEITKMYNRKDREVKRRLQEEKVKAALCSKKSEQLLNEILEERVRVHLRLTEVAVEEGPVPLAEDEEPLPELTAEMDRIVTSAFKSGPGGQVLVEAFSLRITRRDIHTLVGTNWLNDEVINFYMNLLIERGKLDNYPSVYCFNTFFYPKLESQGHSSLKRWTRKIDIFAHELLIVPVHLGVHWCLACINLKEKKILYYDSMGGKNNTCLQTLMRYLQDESMDKKKVKFDNTGWVLENVKDNPQQMNGSDCGMFSCMYAEFLCRRAKITFSQSDMSYFRRKMAYEILSKKLLM
ncbi:Uncharacterized protein GBIM_15766 [Gryllus bimaculatus]|nr:Uncharacterized protein GBIM_15766 [Gryllus bimaculatus]